jgi:hypothetical protein
VVDCPQFSPEKEVVIPSIRIKGVPPGFAPPEIREQWVGIEIPLPTEDELKANPPSGFGIGNANEGGYPVLTKTAIEALLESRRTRAAAFWSKFDGTYLLFKKEVCELLP